jgi:DNA-binding NarL/FixJ family response regulator
MCINLVLADPYPVMLEGLTHVFENTPDFAVKACVTNGDAAMKALLEHEPHFGDGLVLVSKKRLGCA